jgi:hypothetical protein
MLRTLKRRGFISRTPGEPRSIRLLLRPEQIPALGVTGEVTNGAV